MPPPGTSCSLPSINQQCPRPLGVRTRPHNRTRARPRRAPTRPFPILLFFPPRKHTEPTLVRPSTGRAPEPRGSTQEQARLGRSKSSRAVRLRCTSAAQCKRERKTAAVRLNPLPALVPRTSERKVTKQPSWPVILPRSTRTFCPARDVLGGCETCRRRDDGDTNEGARVCIWAVWSWW